MIKTAVVLFQIVFILGAAPFLGGLIAKIKNNFRMRKGAGVFQPYYNLAKLFSKDEVISENASWIFRITPFIVFSAAIMAALLVPVLVSGGYAQYAGDFFAVIFLFALGRFFLALSGLDTASAFGGMGSSREMFISSLAEPVALLAVFSVSLHCGTTNLEAVSGINHVYLSSIIAACSLFMVTLAETSRLPVDNQETHLELTMVHEAMVLEYSGRSLALIEWASYVKQMIWFSIIGYIVFPSGIILYPAEHGRVLLQIGVYLLKLTVIAGVVAVTEVSLAKMRLFRAGDFLAYGLALAVIAVVAAVVGV